MLAKSLSFTAVIGLSILATSVFDQGAASAQNSNAVNSAKIEVLERQVRMLRTRLGLNPEQPEAGAVPAGINPQLVASLSAKIGMLETQIRRLNGRLEEFEHKQRLMQDDIDLLRKELALQRSEIIQGSAVPAPGASAGAGEADGPAVAADGGQALPSVDEAVEEAVVEEAAVSVDLPEGTAAEQFDFAFAFVRKNDLKRGRLAFEKFVASNAGDSRMANAKYWLGRIHLQEGRNAQAAQYLLALIEEHPNHAKRPDALVDLADVLLKLDSAGDACNALAEFRRVEDKASARLKAHAARISTAARCE